MTVDCEDCNGSGEVTHDHPHDPNAKWFKCDKCEGEGTVDHPVDPEVEP